MKMRFALIVGILILLSSCMSVSKSLSDVRASAAATDSAITSAACTVGTAASEADAIVEAARKTGDSALVDLAVQHVDTARKAQAEVAAIQAAHEAEKKALTVADNAVGDLEKHDAAMTKKVDKYFVSMMIASCVSVVCVLLLFSRVVVWLKEKFF